MKRVDVRKTIVNHINQFTGITVKSLVENQDFTPPLDKPSLRLTIRFGRAFGGELGGGVDIESGIAFIDIFVPKNTGDNASLEYAESLRDYCKDEDITYKGNTVSFQIVDIEPVGVEENHYRHQVRVNFYNFVSKG